MVLSGPQRNRVRMTSGTAEIEFLGIILATRKFRC
ncbi:hypothetical protein L914_10083 [Phytophthora nicotianae]|uniref:Uncharacterized protein n=2 Tax=Phytophthora nicotianae TaxID=4792 RepID=V9F2B7_PHYNI|nr:hypothetical protein F443_10465 [Phytophthora nicotianae P1569]ETM44709.1 hypothetical protein L914_10083 [Phytophthora nicotianae]